jgi:hypothetical protein
MSVAASVSITNTQACEEVQRGFEWTRRRAVACSADAKTFVVLCSS